MNNNKIKSDSRVEHSKEIILQFDIPEKVISKLKSNFKRAEFHAALTCILRLIQMAQFSGTSLLHFSYVPEYQKQSILGKGFLKIWEKLVSLNIIEVNPKPKGSVKIFHEDNYYRISPELFGKKSKKIKVSLENYDGTNNAIGDCKLVGHTMATIKKVSVIPVNKQDFKAICANLKEELILESEVEFYNYKKYGLINGSCSKQSIVQNDSNNLYYSTLGLHDIIGTDLLSAHRKELTGRMYNSLFSTSDTTSQLLRLDGEKIIEFELYDSSPLILSTLLLGLLSYHDNHNYSNQLILKPIYSDIFKKYEQMEGLIMSISEEERKNIIKEISHLQDLCINGNLFETLNNHSIWKGNPLGIRALKEEFLVDLFDDDYPATDSRIYMNATYPEIMKLLEMFKNDQNIHAVHDNYPLTDYLLVRTLKIEAHIFVDTILKKLMEEEIYSFTRHDSICCKQSDSKRVKDIMMEELPQIFGEGGYKLKTTIWE